MKAYTSIEQSKKLAKVLNEDERCKKEITELVMEPTWKTEQEFQRRKELVAWLEKQGEHANFRNKIQIGDKVTRNEDGVLVNLSQLKRIAKKSEKQGEQKPYGQRAECLNCQLNYAGECKGFCEMKRGEQKPAWSEEDEEMSKSVIATCELAEQERDSSPARHLLEMQLNWLKSLKQRIGG